ncbi:XRE family transcriptional regulator [Shewanella algae]|uniref:XRE family transcriptional regulator n=1 Tax=Shewanella algae TaxID=38313 RepID=UPI0013DDDC32|nr:XRE family transcriptional regulator [Shewanella algae]MBO2611195.1 LexA family transcriptional regulator [Shewanella algae]MBO2669999.1 LexA family transcriptional regulator [Shewanella algae]MBO2695507.1 LexA family transcriptional regulator [Shewanella algae]
MKKESALSFPTEGVESFAERLKELIGDESLRSFAIAIETSEGGVRKWFTQGTKPSFDKMVRISRLYNVNLEWLCTGEGTKQIETEMAICPGNEFDEEYALINGFHAQVSTGHGAVWDDEKVRRKLAFRTKWLRFRGLQPENLRVVFAKGDSMEPTIHTGDSILVDITQTTLTDGSIFVLRLGDELYAKRLQKHIDGSVTIISDNKEYKEQVVTAADLPMLNIVGKVVWIGKDVK